MTIIGVPPNIMGEAPKLVRKSERKKQVAHLFFGTALILAIFTCYWTAGSMYATVLEDNARLRAKESPAAKLCRLYPNQCVTPSTETEDAAAVSLEEEEIELPSDIMPSFSALFFLFFSVISAWLFHLAKGWSFSFELLTGYEDVSGVSSLSGLDICCYALKDRGKDRVTPIITEDSSYFFFYNRQKFEISQVDNQWQADIVAGSLIETFEFYHNAKPLELTEVARRRKRFMPNSYVIPEPKFLDMYWEAITSPVSCFQFFSMFVLMLEQYSLLSYTSVVILVFSEAMTVFQRKKNFEFLKNISGPKEYVNVQRTDGNASIWMSVGTDELVPGDLIELTRKQGRDNTIPIDGLIISGSCVVSEGSLTGESHPCIKEAAPSSRTVLDFNNEHRKNCVFSGTELISGTTGDRTSPSSDAVLCYVLRTGFSSSQGSLMSMIEFSTSTVAGDMKETTIALCFLLCFAILSSTYVVYEGIYGQHPVPSYNLFLKVCMILTSVVPPHLPIKLAVSVNLALIELGKSQIFCTQPSKLPISGRLTHCLFDKTGTLTADELKPIGVLEVQSLGPENVGMPLVTSPLTEASSESSVIIGGCHSLIFFENAMCGDPMEKSAFVEQGWKWESAHQRATRVMGDQPPIEVHIIKRYPFQSSLQRMTTVVNLKNVSFEGYTQCVLTKGSPEAMRPLFNEVPAAYDQYRRLAEQGMRVIALGWRGASSQEVRGLNSLERDVLEKSLNFAGFLAFECYCRKDSRLVISALRNSGHACLMVTGDSPLTALHVARDVNICDKPVLLLENRQWVSPYQAEAHLKFEYHREEVSQLAQNYDLALTEASLTQKCQEAAENYEELVKHVKVLARMTPLGKAEVVECLRKQGASTIMVGDGGNDVGALGQADIGLALLSGFKNLNVGKAEEVDDNVWGALQSHEHSESTKRKVQGHHMTQEFNRVKAELTAKQQKWVEEEVQALKDSGQEVGVTAYAGCVKRAIQKMTAELQQERARIQTQCNVLGGDSTEEMTIDMVPQVRLGDASISASFTTKNPSIMAVIQIIRQGRCTMLSVIQEQQILILDCMLRSFNFTTMALMQSRNSEAQILFMSMCLMVASMSFTYSAPLENISPIRPLFSLFHPAIWVSLLGQLCIHLVVLTIVKGMAEEAMGSEEMDKIRLFYKQADKVAKLAVLNTPEESMFDFELTTMGALQEKMNKLLFSGPFYPNLINSVLFLTSSVEQMAILFVNYKGRPWMKGITENHYLLLAVFAQASVAFLCAWNVFPSLNSFLQLDEFPDESFKITVMCMLFMGFFGSFILDRLVVFWFAPEHGRAYWEEIKATRPHHFYPVISTVFKTLAGFLLFIQGNPLVWLGAAWFWRRYKRNQEAAEIASYQSKLKSQ